jgi:tetratricopeptide (TPR) repeat protein
VFTGYQEKWNAVQAINAKLKQWGPVLADTNKVWQNAASIHKGQISNMYPVIEYLYTLNNNNQQDSYPSATFAEAGFLRDASNWDYLVVVNRRCAPTQGSVDDRRKMNIKLKKGSGYWAVSEMPSGQYWTLNYNGNFTTSLFEPGEGRLYRVAPQKIYVPSQFPTISAGLAASMGGQIVEVSSGSYNESGTVTVKTGVTLQLDAGVTIAFAAGSKLDVYGKLDANGTDTTANAVMFTCASATPGGWQGIWLYGTETYHELDYTRIKYGNYGVYATTNVEVDLHNCILDRNRDGIYASSGAVYLYDSKVRNNTTSGVTVYGNRPCQFGGSRFSNPGVSGLQFTSASPAIFNSLITQNYRGVVANSSTVDMGLSCDYGGNNSIFSNSSYELSVSYGTIYAQKNWWGYPGIPTSDFYYGPSGTILAWCYLYSPPPSAYLRSEGGGAEDVAFLEQVSISDSAAYDLFASALALQARGDYAGAMPAYKQIPIYYPHSQWALCALMELSKMHQMSIRLGEKGINLTEYLQEIVGVSESAKQNRADDLYGLSLKLLTSEYIRQGNASAALEWCQSTIRAFPDSRWQEDGLYDRFCIDLFLLQDQEGAGKVLNDLQDRYPKSEHLVHACAALGRDTSGLFRALESGEPESKLASICGIPEVYRFSNNFPNPFNPETEIGYALPEAGHVLIEIYNILGQKIATLVEENKAAGNYTVKWRGFAAAGGKVPAGVYFCRMRCNDFTATTKMTLLP